MRQVKKWIAFVQVFALMVTLFSGLVLTTEVSATTAALAEMDLSAFSADASVTANGILNSGSANDVSFVASGTTMPEVGTLNSLVGETKYLRFGERKGDEETTNDRVADNTQDRKVTVSGASINNMEENTVSFWAYLDSKDATDTVATDINMKDVFYYNGSTAGKYLARLRLYPWGTLTQYYNYDYDNALDSFTTSPTDALIYSDVIRQKWAHFVYTTKYDETENKFTTQYIVNGVAKPAQVWPGPAGGRADETNFTYQLSEGFCGNIGGFKIYDKAFSEAEALALYNTESIAYTEETATNLSVVSVLPAGDTTLALNGSIEIEFNTYPKLETLNAITLAEENGEDAITSRSVNGKKVTLTYGPLTESEPYFLTLGSELRSMSGLAQATGAEAVYQYTAEYEPTSTTLDFVGDVIYTKQDGSVVGGFSGATAITATFSMVNHTELPTSVTAILAVYEGEDKQLVDCAVSTTYSLVVGETKNNMSVTLSGLTPNSNQRMVLYLWENLSTIKPLKPPIEIPYQAPTTAGAYIFEYTPPLGALNPSGVSAENFTVSAPGEGEVKIAAAYYYPQTNSVELQCDAKYVYATAYSISASSLQYMDGTLVDFSGVTVYPIYKEQTNYENT